MKKLTTINRLASTLTLVSLTLLVLILGNVPCGNAQTPEQKPTNPAPAQKPANQTPEQKPTNPAPEQKPATPAAPAQRTCPDPNNPNDPKYPPALVTKVAAEDTKKYEKYGVELGDVILVTVENYKTLNDEAKCTSPEKNIVLYLDERPVAKGTAYPPSEVKLNEKETTLRFTLTPTYKPEAGGRDVWTHVLGEPPLTQARNVPVSIGIEDRYAIAAKEGANASINLRVIPLRWFLFWLLIFAILVVGFFVLARKTDLLRDTGQSPSSGARRPYSLARTQIAWWFFITLAAYLLIGIITGDFSTSITGTVLTLLGISAGTALASAAVDANKDNPGTQAQEANAALTLQTKIAGLDAEIKNLDPTDNDPAAQQQLAALRSQRAMKEAELNKLSGLKDPDAQAKAAALNLQADTTLLDDQISALDPTAGDLAARQQLATLREQRATRESELRKLNNENEHFVKDILSDANGISFHRFQIAAWTLVLGLIFAFQVYKVLAMPTFGVELLTLMGISAGTYVGLKGTEATVPKTAP